MPAPLTLWFHHKGPGPTCIIGATIYMAYNSPNKKDTVIFTQSFAYVQCMSGHDTLKMSYSAAFYVFMRNKENYFGFH